VDSPSPSFGWFYFQSYFWLSVISVVAGRDLWKLRNRGRKLAVISMVLRLLVSALIAIVGWETALTHREVDAAAPESGYV